MKVAIVGSRSYCDLPLVAICVYSLPDNTEIISGDAVGVDMTAKKTAGIRRLKYRGFKPDWKKYGKSAGMIRNKQIIDYADIVIAYWDGVSSGTRSIIELARKAGKLLCVVYEIREDCDE